LIFVFVLCRESNEKEGFEALFHVIAGCVEHDNGARFCDRDAASFKGDIGSGFLHLFTHCLSSYCCCNLCCTFCSLLWKVRFSFYFLLLHYFSLIIYLYISTFISWFFTFFVWPNLFLMWKMI